MELVGRRKSNSVMSERDHMVSHLLKCIIRAPHVVVSLKCGQSREEKVLEIVKDDGIKIDTS